MVVNLEKVKHYSPLQYPGGKTWLVPYVKEWMKQFPHNDSSQKSFIEPFAGGGIIGLTVAFEHLAEDVYLLDLDDNLDNLWKCMGRYNECQELIKLIEEFEFDLLHVKDLLARKFTPEDEPCPDWALQTIVSNRAHWSGIIAPGAGLSRVYPEKDKRSRWYPSTIIGRVKDILALIRQNEHLLGFYKQDGMKMLKSWYHRKDIVWFIDPPYTVKTKSHRNLRLYNHTDINNDALFKVASELKGPFLMTYNSSEEIDGLAAKYDLPTKQIPMKTQHNIVKTETLISKHLV